MLPDLESFWGWGEEVASFFDVIAKNSTFSWRTIYKDNQRKLRKFGQVVELEKADVRQIEGSVNPGFLWKLADKYDLKDLYEKNVDMVMKQRQKPKDVPVYDKLHTPLLRKLYEEVDDVIKSEFMTDVFLQKMQEMHEEGIKDIEIQAAPLAWSFGYKTKRDVDRDKVIEVSEELFNAFDKAKKEFLKTSDMDKDSVRMAVTLRREDDTKEETKGLNKILIDTMSENGVKTFVIGGFTDFSENEVELVRSIHDKGGRARIICGQVTKKEIKDVMGKTLLNNRIDTELRQINKVISFGDSLMYTTYLLTADKKIRDEMVKTVNEAGASIVISVSEALGVGFKIDEVVGLIRQLPESTKLKVVSGNTAIWDGLSTQIFRLIEDGKLGMEEVARYVV